MIKPPKPGGFYPATDPGKGKGRGEFLMNLLEMEVIMLLFCNALLDKKAQAFLPSFPGQLQEFFTQKKCIDYPRQSKPMDNWKFK